MEGKTLGAKAFQVFTNYLTSQVANEDSRMETEISVLRKPLHDHFNSVELRTANGVVVAFQGLDNAVIVDGMI